MNVDDAVTQVFARLATGELTQTADVHEDGWEAMLPSGEVVVRSRLQAEAVPLITLGRPAVAYIERWTTHVNRALRYVATYAIEKIEASSGED